MAKALAAALRGWFRHRFPSRRDRVFGSPLRVSRPDVNQRLSGFADIPVLLVGGRQYTSGICWASSIFKIERILVSIWIYRAVLADDNTWPILSA